MYVVACVCAYPQVTMIRSEDIRLYASGLKRGVVVLN